MTRKRSGQIKQQHPLTPRVVSCFIFVLPPDRGAYYHPLFVKGDRDLCRHIRRIKVKGTGPPRKKSRPENQPNLYPGGDLLGSVVTPHPSPQIFGGVGMTPPALAILSPPPVTPVRDGSFPMSPGLARSQALSFPDLTPPPSCGVGFHHGCAVSLQHTHAGLGGPHPSLPSILSAMLHPRPQASKVSTSALPSPLCELYRQVLRVAVADAWKEAAAAPVASSLSKESSRSP
jgi:hypothetical protein